MTRAFPIVLGCFLMTVGCVGSSAVEAADGMGARWGDKTFGGWLEQLQDQDADKRLAAIRILRLMLSFKDPGWCCLGPCPPTEQLGILDAPEALPILISALSDPEWDVRTGVAGVIVDCGPPAKGAVPQLRAMLANRRTAEAALVALAAIGESAADAAADVQAKLADKDPQVRFAAARALWEIRRDPLAVEACCELVRESSGTIVFEVIGFMTEQMGQRAALLIPIVMSLKDAEPLESDAPPSAFQIELKRRIFQLLAAVGPPAEDHLPLLIAGLRSDQWSVDHSTEAIARIGPDAKDAVPTLLTRLEAIVGTDAKRASIRYGADIAKLIQALGCIGPAAEAAVPDLIKELNDPHVVASAAEALGRIGPAAKPAVPRLVELFYGDPKLRGPTGLALWRIERHPEAITRLTSSVVGGDEQPARALGEIGLPAASAAKVLREQLGETGNGVSIAAAEALWKITHDRAALDWLRRQAATKLPGSVQAAAALWRCDHSPEAKALVIEARYYRLLHKEAMMVAQRLKADSRNDW